MYIGFWLYQYINGNYLENYTGMKHLLIDQTCEPNRLSSKQWSFQSAVLQQRPWPGRMPRQKVRRDQKGHRNALKRGASRFHPKGVACEFGLSGGHCGMWFYPNFVSTIGKHEKRETNTTCIGSLKSGNDCIPTRDARFLKGAESLNIFKHCKPSTF